MAAVRAIPRSNPGTLYPFRSGRRLGSVEGGDQIAGANPFERDQLAAVAAHLGNERTRPAILVDDQERSGPRLEFSGGQGDVVIAE